MNVHGGGGGGVLFQQEMMESMKDLFSSFDKFGDPLLILFLLGHLHGR